MPSSFQIVRLLVFAALGVASVAAQDKAIDVSRSSITIHVSKAGLLSAFAHDHWIKAPIESGAYNESSPRVEFKVLAAKMEVKPDPKVDAKDQAQIQKDMHESTLESAKFPDIRFRSTSIVKSGDVWKVEGMLTLHGMTKPVKLDVKKSGDAYTGTAKIKQTDFGIKPVSVAGGTIKVKDGLEVAFEIR
ncbi:MAG: YceI family protein [Bryobacteraceae bacterium]